MLGLRTETIAQIVILALLLGGGGAFLWSVFHAGERAAQTHEAIEEAGEAVDAAKANKDSAVAAAHASDEFARQAARIAQETADGRAEIHRPRQTAPDRVGADALVDPELSRDVICRIERLRGDPPRASCRAAAPGADERPAPG